MTANAHLRRAAVATVLALSASVFGVVVAAGPALAAPPGYMALFGEIRKGLSGVSEPDFYCDFCRAARDGLGQAGPRRPARTRRSGGTCCARSRSTSTGVVVGPVVASHLAGSASRDSLGPLDE